MSGVLSNELQQRCLAVSETIYKIGEFPGHEVLASILDDNLMPENPGRKLKAAAFDLDVLNRYLMTVQGILEELGYPKTSMELDALVFDIDSGEVPDELAMTFTLLLRLVHQTRSAWKEGELSKFGFYMGQLCTVTAEAKYYERLPHTISGMKSYAGAQKSVEQRAKYRKIKPSHERILREGTNLLSLGSARHELASRVHRRFSHRDGFPSSLKQYRTILKPLISKKD